MKVYIMLEDTGDGPDPRVVDHDPIRFVNTVKDQSIGLAPNEIVGFEVWEDGEFLDISTTLDELLEWLNENSIVYEQ